MKKILGLLAGITMVLGGVAVSAPVQATAPASPCAIKTGAEWNSKNPGKQKARDLGALIPGVNAGPLGTDVACMPVPALDFASTAKLQSERGAKVEKISQQREMPDPSKAALKAKAGTAGKSLPSKKRLATCSPSNCLFHAAGSHQFLTGVTSHTWTQRVAKPGLGSDGLPNGHTLAEGTVANPAPGGGTNFVELGTTVDANVCGGTGVSPCIFVFRWNPSPGVYNGGGWINASGCNPCMGTSVTSWVGTSKIFSLSFISGYWWASANNQYVAGIPASTWPSSNFTSGDRIDEFFEVAVGNNTMTTTPNTDMGDNKLAACSGTVQGSYFINGKYNGTNVVNLSVYNQANNGAVVDTSKYDVCLAPGRTDFMRGGGPGW
jgi:hypothetical protein